MLTQADAILKPFRYDESQRIICLFLHAVVAKSRRDVRRRIRIIDLWLRKDATYDFAQVGVAWIIEVDLCCFVAGDQELDKKEKQTHKERGQHAKKRLSVFQYIDSIFIR